MIKTKMLAALVATSAILYGATSTENNVTTWSPNYYQNNIDVSQELCIPGAEMLKVTISGETEKKWDIISVADNNFSGPLSEELDVSGPCVTARFTTDTSVQKGEGPTVRIVETDVDTVTWKPEYNETASYAHKKVCIEDATKGLEVRITGETEENYDYISIEGKDYDYNYKKAFSGSLNTFALVGGNCVDLKFTSDKNTKTGDGPTVTVTKHEKDDHYLLVWEPKYTNNADESIEMCNFTKKMVFRGLTIIGETEENNDFLTINEKNRYSGLFEQEAQVEEASLRQTDCIRLRFQTNGSVIQGKGLTVSLNDLPR